MQVRFQPHGARIDAEPGQTLLEAARAAGVDVEAVCGGRGTCGKCRVLAPEGVSPPTEAELDRLTPDEIRQGYRLACQAIIVADVNVVVPEESRVSRVSILSEGVEAPLRLDPWARRVRLHVPDATLENQTADLDNLRTALQAAGVSFTYPELSALRELPGALRAEDGAVTAVLVRDRLVHLTAGHHAAHALGMAFDIGTTTVVGYLLDLETGKQLSVASLLNPQTGFGDDVVSRIGHAAKAPEHLETLRREIVEAMNTIIARATAQAGVRAADVYAVTVVGNTTMLHLFLGVNPEALARSPYVPAVTDSVCLPARDLGLATWPDALVCTLPNIAGWVGADTTAVILATRLHEHEEPALAIDIGTNGEMALGSRHRLITCSTAAGPAFEGAHLSCGMRAADGAIDAVRFDHELTYHVIGAARPRGVCGSGLVDLVAEMLRSGVIDATGMMQDPDAVRANGSPALADRIGTVGRQRTFELVTASEGADGRPVRVTQRDVRELQLAKGAIRAGIEILMDELGITPADVRRVYLAGAFGNYIRPASALAIGLMPHFPRASIVPVGNAAGSGARLALLSRVAFEEATDLVRRVEYLELSGRADFQEHFAEAMIFPSPETAPSGG